MVKDHCYGSLMKDNFLCIPRKKGYTSWTALEITSEVIWHNGDLFLSLSLVKWSGTTWASSPTSSTSELHEWPWDKQPSSPVAGKWWERPQRRGSLARKQVKKAKGRNSGKGKCARNEDTDLRTEPNTVVFLPPARLLERGTLAYKHCAVTISY